jgi:hypothetical protein
MFSTLPGMFEADTQGLMLDITAFGGNGNGVFDNTTAIFNARAAARAAGGGTILYPAGVYIAGNQDISNDANIYHRGVGYGASVIKLKSGANTDLFSGQTSLINLSAGFGTGPAGTLFNFGFFDLTLDGNKAGQSSGPSYPLRFYGCSYVMQNIRVKNGFSGNILCDWSGFNNFPVGADSMESQWINVKTHDSGGIGIQYGGPHDSMMHTTIPFLEGSHCLHLGPNASGLQMTDIHAWQPAAGAVAILCEAPGVYAANCQAESSDTCQVAVLGSGFVWDGGNVFGASPFTTVGFKFGQQAGETPFAGQIRQAAGVTQAYNPTNCRINSRISNCQHATNGPLWLDNDGGSNLFDITCDQSALGGDQIDGKFAQTSVFRWNTFGITPDGTRAKGNFYLFPTKAFHGFAITDRTNDVFSIDTQNYLLQLVQGMAIQLYSDQYTTLKMSLNGTGNGEVKLGNSSSIYSGNGVPAAGLGANGDFYFRTDTPGTANQRIYIKSAGAWVALTV